MRTLQVMDSVAEKRCCKFRRLHIPIVLWREFGNLEVEEFFTPHTLAN